jgi:hypothetical protein
MTHNLSKTEYIDRQSEKCYSLLRDGGEVLIYVKVHKRVQNPIK